MQRILLNPRILFAQASGGGGGGGGSFGGGGDFGGGGAAPRRVQTLVLQPLQPRVDRLAALYARLWSSGYSVQEERFLSGAAGTFTLAQDLALDLTPNPRPRPKPHPHPNPKRLLTGATGRGLPSLTLRAELRSSAPRTAAESAAAEGAAVAGGAALGAAVAESAALRAAAAGAGVVLGRVVADDDAAYRAFLEEQREALGVELAGMRRAAPCGAVAPAAVARRHEAARRRSVFRTRPCTLAWRQ